MFCVTDEIAEEVYKIAAALGCRIPQESSVIGYGHADFGSRLDPPLATVRQRPYHVGMAAARLVVARIEAAIQAAPHIERLSVELVPRRPIGAPASR